MRDVKVSRRGYYYDLEASPYEFTSPYGDVFKFPSQKKKEIYVRDILKEIEKLDKILARSGASNHIEAELIELFKRGLYRGFYKSVVR